MAEIMTYSSKINCCQKILLLFLVLFCVNCDVKVAFANSAKLRGIFAGEAKPEIRLQVTERITGKVIMVDDKEVLIALKNITQAQDMIHFFKSNDVIRKIEIDELPGNVLAIVVTGKVPFKSVTHSWDRNGLNLTVFFNVSGTINKSKSSSSTKKEKFKREEIDKVERQQKSKTKKNISKESLTPLEKRDKT